VIELVEGLDRLDHRHRKGDRQKPVALSVRHPEVA